MTRMSGIGLLAIATLMACRSDRSTSPPEGPAATLFAASGNVTPTVDEFRTALGPPNGGIAGEQLTGRREINWDGAVANPFNNRNDFPAGFFNSTVRAGAVFETPGTGFRNDSTLFVDINPTYAAQFAFLSRDRIFTPVGSNQFDVLFQVAGQPTPALVSGFGIVLSDVDVIDGTRMQLFTSDGSELGTFSAPVRSDAAGLSFLGVTFTEPLIARVRVTLGTGALGVGVNDVSAGGTKDLVVMDNLVYGEPKHAF